MLGRFALLGLITLGACAKSRSTEIKISEFYASYSVAGMTSGKISCVASLQVGSGFGATDIELSSDDTLTCSVGSQTKQMSNGVIGTTYSVDDMDYSPGEPYTITLTKDGTEYPATITFPVAISITSPANSSTQSLSSSLTVTWSGQNSGDTVESILSSSGGGSASESATDSSGSLTFTASKMASGAVAAGTGTLSLTRTASGTIPSQFVGGIFTAKQSSSITITLQ